MLFGFLGFEAWNPFSGIGEWVENRGCDDEEDKLLYVWMLRLFGVYVSTSFSLAIRVHISIVNLSLLPLSLSL